MAGSSGWIADNVVNIDHAVKGKGFFKRLPKTAIAGQNKRAGQPGAKTLYRCEDVQKEATSPNRLADHFEP